MSAPVQSIADVLERAADLIEPEGAWIQGALWRDSEGRDLDEDGDKSDATCWCTVGATLAVAGLTQSLKADRFFSRFLGFDFSGEVEVWNDAPERTQQEVVAKLREAAALAREQGK